MTPASSTTCGRCASRTTTAIWAPAQATASTCANRSRRAPPSATRTPWENGTWPVATTTMRMAAWSRATSSSAAPRPSAGKESAGPTARRSAKSSPRGAASTNVYPIPHSAARKRTVFYTFFNARKKVTQSVGFGRTRVRAREGKNRSATLPPTRSCLKTTTAPPRSIVTTTTTGAPTPTSASSCASRTRWATGSWASARTRTATAARSGTPSPGATRAAAAWTPSAFRVVTPAARIL